MCPMGCGVNSVDIDGWHFSVFMYRYQGRCKAQSTLLLS